MTYSYTLARRLQEDIQRYLGYSVDLTEENSRLLNRLVESGLLPTRPNDEFGPQRYNVITKRFRDYWMNYFLRSIYHYEYSLASFDIWVYRAKQIGIVHATEFYPNFSGRIVFPTSILAPATRSRDFQELYSYHDGSRLYLHRPNVDDKNINQFVAYLVKAYFDLRGSSRSYFISLPALRELVCYNLRMSESLFEVFLNRAYRLNLEGNLQIRISLEVDKLPEETQAMYLTQEPVMVDGTYRNIIAIDVTKGERYHE